MAFFKKKNTSGDDPSEVKTSSKVKKEPKPKKDKSIKPRAPKAMAAKKVVRTFFWIFASLLLLKGAIAFAQGNRTINQTIVEGNTTPIIADSVKGFAADFATEYFTWDSNFVSDRTTRLSNFIKGIDPDMGLKNFDVKGSSKVISAEIYGTNQIDQKHIDVTVVVWRDVQKLPDQLLEAQGKAVMPPVVKKKTYMIVPVTLAEEGPVIQSYPRFVSEQQRGETVEDVSTGKLVGDEDLINKSKELADSYLRSWYEGNAGQLRYFYSDTVKAPVVIQKSAFTYQKIDKVSVYELPAGIGEETKYRIEANVLVNSDIDEPFANSWNLEVVQQDGRLYVLSNGIITPTDAVATAEETKKDPAPVESESTSTDNKTIPKTEE
ncbi:conjugal transfer protein (plasmid) [Paenibacillus rhizovicinus]|uniref:Conjugal transfer protein n=1 Tax=Paenibacillus rhizovicinus TaxID=2704463 RepID=A0A6C0PAQ3_9BACL|nr:conjugal transfer protein [Paenibacillus rhizovicinus]QHW35455.1 conjugal transfer protein [Paenibacillus rhizovicinus]